MREDIKAVIFDQDGLMFDTERISVEAWHIMGEAWGIHLEEAFLSTIRGMNIPDAAERFRQELGGSVDYLKFKEAKQERFEAMLRQKPVPVKPGLRELLAYLKEHGYKIAMATASTQEYSMENLRDAGITDFFDYIITGDMVEHAKPDPEVFLKSAEALGERPEHCMVLEDSLNGVEAGIRGGFFTVMVPDLTQPDDVLRSRVDRVCTSLLEVKEMLEGLS